MHEDETPRSSALPPPTPMTPSTAGPPRATPKARLAPHRLAKLANALGVSTPLPAHHPFSASTPNLGLALGDFASSSSAPSPSLNDRFVRSPTPSSASTAGAGFSNTFQPPSNSTSRFLLHVVPPNDLPHDVDVSDTTTMARPATSGYHPHFHRGILVPVYPTLVSQLHAIAKEYALPSTTGLLLYLVSSSAPARGPGLDNSDEEPGPRISDEVWKHIWTRVVRAERADPGPSSRSGTPMLGLSLATSPLSAHSGALWTRPLTPNSTIASSASRPRLQETASAPAGKHPLTPAHSTSSSESHSQSHTNPRPSISTEYSDADGNYSMTSMSDAGDGLDLPGLSSASLIPVLAKVELLVDTRKATWYEPWLRSRKQAHKRRAESRSRAESRAAFNEPEERPPLLDLALVNKLARPFSPMTPSVSDEQEVQSEVDSQAEGYAPLDEPEDEDEGEDFDSTTRVIPMGGDPLADVFGTDEDAFAEIRDESSRRESQQSRPDVVDLALDAGSMSDLPPLDDEPDLSLLEQQEHEISEVEALWNRHSRPQIGSIVSPPISTPASPEMNSRRRASSTSTAATVRKHIPPPLILPPIPTTTIEASSISPGLIPPDTANSSNLPYISGASPSPSPSALEHVIVVHKPEGDIVAEGAKIISPVEKRGGTFYHNLELGLEASVDDDDDLFDDNDPNDRRKSQYLMQQQLDEIERALVQFSPRKLQYEEEEQNVSTSTSSPSFPPETSLGDASIRSIAPTGVSGGQWPAVPFTKYSSPIPSRPLHPALNGSSPPRLALNGVTKDVPVIPPAPRRSDQNQRANNESARRRELQEQEALYYPLPPVGGFHSKDSPIIPLSPDPFGRYSSTQPSVPPLSSMSSIEDSMSYFDPRASPMPPSSDAAMASGRASATPSSRFSTDSLAEDLKLNNNGNNGNGNSSKTASMVSVRSIKKLWRKSNKSSISSTIPGSAAGATPSDWNSQQQPTSPPPVPMTPQPGQSFFDNVRPSISSDTGRRTSNNSPIPPASPPRPASTDVRVTTRKSILKSWKSHTSQASISSSSPPDKDKDSKDSKDKDNKDKDQDSSEPAKRKRRPSIFEAAQSVMRGLPPSPNLPEQYQGSQPGQPTRPPSMSRSQSHTYSHSRQSSVVSLKPKPKAGHPSASTSASTSTSTSPLPPPTPNVSSLPASPPPDGMASSPRPSYESSFDTSEFEMVSETDVRMGMGYSAYHGYVEAR